MSRGNSAAQPAAAAQTFDIWAEFDAAVAADDHIPKEPLPAERLVLDEQPAAARPAAAASDGPERDALAIAKNNALILKKREERRAALQHDLQHYLENHSHPGYRKLTIESYLAQFERMPQTQKLIETLYYKMRFSEHGEGAGKSPQWLAVAALPEKTRLKLTFRVFDWLRYLLITSHGNGVHSTIIDKILAHEICWAYAYFPDVYVPSILAISFLKIQALRDSAPTGLSTEKKDRYIFDILCEQHPLLARFPTKIECTAQLVLACFKQHDENALTEFTRAFVGTLETDWIAVFKEFITASLRKKSIPIQAKLAIITQLLQTPLAAGGADSTDSRIREAIKAAARTLVLDALPEKASRYILTNALDSMNTAMTSWAVHLEMTVDEVKALMFGWAEEAMPKLLDKSHSIMPEATLRILGNIFYEANPRVVPHSLSSESIALTTRDLKQSWMRGLTAFMDQCHLELAKTEALLSVAAPFFTRESLTSSGTTPPLETVRTRIPAWMTVWTQILLQTYARKELTEITQAFLLANPRLMPSTDAAHEILIDLIGRNTAALTPETQHMLLERWIILRPPSSSTITDAIREQRALPALKQLLADELARRATPSAESARRATLSAEPARRAATQAGVFAEAIATRRRQDAAAASSRATSSQLRPRPEL